ncbi:MAG TPA: fused MFS/spermidine synthase, partial [Acidimicrobiia bacterium]|nr:fused MFS/spermidine synthase [Acidimicrobiia bacterium]
GGRAVPWHRTTAEFVADIDRVLRADGVYTANVIDGPELRFVRAMALTLRGQWEHVAVIGAAERFETGGNLVVAASHLPFDRDELTAAARAYDVEVQILLGTDLEQFIADARPLTDDRAPVDQLLG